MGAAARADSRTTSPSTRSWPPQPRRCSTLAAARASFAERLLAAGVEVVAVDQSERMVELTRAEASTRSIGDVQALPFATASSTSRSRTSCSTTSPISTSRWPRSPACCGPGVLVAATNGVRQLAELWELVGSDSRPVAQTVHAGDGEALLLRDFADVRASGSTAGTMLMTAEDMRDYIAHSIAHKDAAASCRTSRAPAASRHRRPVCATVTRVRSGSLSAVTLARRVSGYSDAKPKSSRRFASAYMSGESRTTAMSEMPPRVADATRHGPALCV